jgi:integrase
MAGSMRQRGDSWLLTAYAGWDPNAKKRRYVTKTVRCTKREAGKALAEFVSEVNKQQRPSVSLPSPDHTVLWVLERWLEARRGVLSPSTVARYQVAIKHVRARDFADIPVMKLRPHHIEDLYSALVGKGQSGSSIRKLHWAMRQSLAWAHRRGYTIMVATSGIELPPLGERKVAPPTSGDVRTLIEHAMQSNIDWGTAIALLAWTGCRRGELCGLRWKDGVDPSQRGRPAFSGSQELSLPGAAFGQQPLGLRPDICIPG